VIAIRASRVVLGLAAITLAGASLTGCARGALAAGDSPAARSTVSSPPVDTDNPSAPAASVQDVQGDLDSADSATAGADGDVAAADSSAATSDAP
jgi:hypothetical protein